METDAPLPRHVAIIMDGNGRWARQRNLPRIAGHRAGVTVVQEVVRLCLERQIRVLTVWAFSSENWKRSPEEVTFLMGLFRSTLEQEAERLHQNNVRLSILGDRSRFDPTFCSQIVAAENLTRHNSALHLVVAFNYGGRWDIVQAVSRLIQELAGQDCPAAADLPDLIQQRLCLPELPEPDLLIRTSGEQRISNFFLWQLAYTELYFTDVFWPDFDGAELDRALAFYASRERRYGGVA